MKLLEPVLLEDGDKLSVPHPDTVVLSVPRGEDVELTVPEMVLNTDGDAV